MKKTTAIIITIIMLAVFVAGGLLYSKVYKPAHTNETQSSVYYAQGMNKSRSGNKVLLAELENDDFHLYKDGDYIILSHGGQETEFSDWSEYIADETPQMYYDDYNDDGEKELLIRALEGTDERTKEKYYCVYVLFITTDENGKYKYSVTMANRSTWYTTFSNLVNCEVSQPTINKKRVQLVMEQSGKSIAYDSATGIVNGSRGWYIKSLTDEKGNYLTFKDWYMGPGIITVNTDKKTLDIKINIYITYNETSADQLGGVMTCGLTLIGNSFSVTQRSVTFKTTDEYKISSLLKTPDKDWSYTSENSAPYSSSDKVLDNISARHSLKNDVASDRTNFSGNGTENAALDKIVITQNAVKLYAKQGYIFPEKAVAAGLYTLNIDVEGVRCDITLSAEVSTENGISVLTYNLDKNYTREELQNFTFKVGSSNI